MTCYHAKINDSDWSDAANVDAADAVEFQLQRFVQRVDACRRSLSVKTCSQFDATQRNAGTSVILLTD